MDANKAVPTPSAGTGNQPGTTGSVPASAAKPAVGASTASAGSAPAKPATAPAPAPAAPPPPVPLELARLPLPFQGVDFSLRGVHAEAKVAPEQVVEAAQLLDKEGFSIDTVTGVDWMAEGQMEVIYDYFHMERNLRVAIRARIPRDNPQLPTISSVFPGANWHERETHDFFGIVFVGHPNLEPFLLPEDATYHPLRKDFTSC